MSEKPGLDKFSLLDGHDVRELTAAVHELKRAIAAAELNRQTEHRQQVVIMTTQLDVMRDLREVATSIYVLLSGQTPARG